MKTTSMLLTDEQLVLLDGHVDERDQEHVDDAKRRLRDIQDLSFRNPTLTAPLAELISDLLAVAGNEGKLAFQRRGTKKCRVCGDQAGYETYKRNTKYHHKGEVRLDKPLYLSAIDLSPHGSFMRGYVELGCCVKCWQKHREMIAEALSGVQAMLPTKLMGYPPCWERWIHVSCLKCGWKGHEGELGLMPAMMGGTFRGRCPSCDAKTLPLGHDTFERDPAHFTMVPVEPELVSIT